MFRRIGEYISLDLFYFVNLTSSCSLIPRDDVFLVSCANLTERPAFVIYCDPLLCSNLLWFTVISCCIQTFGIHCVPFLYSDLFVIHRDQWPCSDLLWFTAINCTVSSLKIYIKNLFDLLSSVALFRHIVIHCHQLSFQIVVILWHLFPFWNRLMWFTVMCCSVQTFGPFRLHLFNDAVNSNIETVSDRRSGARTGTPGRLNSMLNMIPWVCAVIGGPESRKACSHNCRYASSGKESISGHKKGPSDNVNCRRFAFLVCERFAGQLGEKHL